MKLLGFFVSGVLAGFLLGGWSPRSDLYDLEKKIFRLEQKLHDHAYNGNPSLRGITQMLNVPAHDEETSAQKTETGDATIEEPTELAPAYAPHQGLVEDIEPELFEDKIERAAELWTVRSQLARDAFLANISATEEQAGRFDVLVEAMNIRLEHAIEKWAGILKEGSMSGREAGVRMMNEITNTLVLSYDEMNRAMPNGWSNAAGINFQFIDHIDPYVASPLAGLEGKFQFD